MPDPIRKHVSPPPLEHNLFESTSLQAGHVAARFAGVRYRQILTHLKERPACIFEIAAALSTPDHPVFDHQISGRFGELVEATLILRTGIRRRKPTTNCQCDEYAITTIGLGVLAEATSNPVQKGVE